MKDMNDYIRAYSQLEPLLNDYDRQLENHGSLQPGSRERGQTPPRRTTLPQATSHELAKHVGDSERYPCLEQGSQTGNVGHPKHGFTS